VIGDFNIPNFDWKRGLSLPNSHYYSKLKVDAIYTSTCLLDLSHCIDTVGSSNLLGLIFSNLRDLGITPVDPGLIKTDNYNPPLIINICLPFATCVRNYVYRTVNSRLGIMHCFTILNLWLVLCLWYHRCRFCCHVIQSCCSRCHGTGNSPWHHKH
jgi:hypothetical protein